MTGKIFINYRRDDVPGDARSIRDALAAKFGKLSVFMDVDNLLAGQRFDKELAKALDQCGVLVAVMGPRWMEQLAARAGSGERDYVREEIAAALKRGITVIPVRVGREGVMAPLPRAEQLPEDIRELVLHQKLDVAHERFGRDAEELISAIAAIRRGGRRDVPWAKVAAAGVVVAILAAVGLYGPPRWGFGAAVEGGPETEAVRAAPTNGGGITLGPGNDVAPNPMPTNGGPGTVAEEERAANALAPMKIEQPGSMEDPKDSALKLEAEISSNSEPEANAPQGAAKVNEQIAMLSNEKSKDSDRKPGETFRDCYDVDPVRNRICPELVVVPAGEFTMGSSDYSDERPPHTVTIAKPFAVGKFEITFDEWDACVSALGCQHKPGDQGWGRDRRPVVDVSWNDAQEYLGWLSQRAGKAYRLLTEAEWEYAARAGTATTYSWGNDIGHGNANCEGCGSEWDNKQTSPVGSFKANAFGLHDMHGNVYEWVEDCYKDSYVGAPIDGSASPSGDCSRRVVRGGAWYGTPDGLRSANRLRASTDNRDSYVGFRVGRTLSP